MFGEGQDPSKHVCPSTGVMSAFSVEAGGGQTQGPALGSLTGWGRPQRPGGGSKPAAVPGMEDCWEHWERGAGGGGQPERKVEGRSLQQSRFLPEGWAESWGWLRESLPGVGAGTNSRGVVLAAAAQALFSSVSVDLGCKGSRAEPEWWAEALRGPAC